MVAGEAARTARQSQGSNPELRHILWLSGHRGPRRPVGVLPSSQRGKDGPVLAWHGEVGARVTCHCSLWTVATASRLQCESEKETVI